MDKEIWKPVPDTKGYYEVSNHGNIRSWNNRGHNRPDRRSEPKLLDGKWTDGYNILHEKINDRYLKVHRIVLKVFVGDPPKGKPLALHKDGDSTNNYVNNLYWGDYKDNAEDMVNHGNAKFGSKNETAKIVESDVKDIRDMYLDGVPVAEICEMYPINIRNTYSCISGEHWGHIEYRLDEVKEYQPTTRNLTKEEVIKIKKLLDDGVMQKDIAEMFNSTRSNICNIKLGRSWSHVQL